MALSDSENSQKKNQEDQPISGRVLNPGPPEYEAEKIYTDSDERLEAEGQQLLGAVISGD
jgi:hypothetical protein